MSDREGSKSSFLLILTHGAIQDYLRIKVRDADVSRCTLTRREGLKWPLDEQTGDRLTD